jgi:hypothetical protein
LEAVEPPPDGIAIFVHPRRVSAMRGLKNTNIEILKKQFGLARIEIIPDAGVEEEGLKLDVRDL